MLGCVTETIIWSHLATKMIVCLFVLRFNIPVNNFSVMLRLCHRFLGINQYSGESLCSCSRTQHGAACEDRTQDLSILSLMLYHYATVLPQNI